MIKRFVSGRMMVGSHKKLSIAIYWHFHQPYYRLEENGDYLMPWSRLHAVKDYLTMLRFAKKFENLKLNINIVPILLEDIVNYSNEANDIHSILTVKDTANLTSEDKKFILNNFFDANYKTMIEPVPRYKELATKAQFLNHSEEFLPQDYSDLMALYNLVWINTTFDRHYPTLKKLREKSKNYSLQDRIEIINIHRKIIKSIIPEIKKLLKEQKIELTTSPYYHPLLPALLDINDITRNSDNDLPKNLEMKSEAEKQIKMALDKFQKVFKFKPSGLWLSELGISTKTVKFLDDMGIKWTIADEYLLSNSLKKEFVRDFDANLEDPYPLLKTYKLKDSSLKIVFRDAVFPNMIIYEYSNALQKQSANDLYDRIKTIQAKLQTSPDENHLLTLALDGENFRENYENNADEFLTEFYKLLTEDNSLETVLITDYLSSDKHYKELNSIKAGTWINQNFKLWIDEPIKNKAWNYLYKVKKDFDKISKTISNENQIKKAHNELMICEGSDWFWWYGEPNDSGHDNVFDYIFRTHLKNVYKYLGKKPPAFLDENLV